ncbi:SEC-C domain-containing protein [Sporosarcina luteola]|uniref:SEC-C domain-containing protein n=1 Tax=Sporosarcina luteola TaxID=582850 RepID=UPI00203F5B86|nr:SEC-C domain-containing protein [Sporosarcina luteola]MCM3711062.1 SEC-C domain-containing protein [Sporosarcina luteola]
MELQIDPYEPCPCGSDKKYKFCCYQKAREEMHKNREELSHSDDRLNHMAQQRWGEADFEVCFGFDKEKCKPLIKGAHSIQNNRVLNRISKDGHLYHIGSKLTKSGPYPILKKISRNKASKFFGFCDYHDTEIFKPIELKDYSQEPIENYLFAFRSLTLEYHRKIRVLNQLRDNFKSFPSATLDPMSVNFYRTALLDFEDYSKDYNSFKKDYLERNFNGLRTVYRKLDFEIGFATSSAFTVQYDYKGKQINDIYFDKSVDKMPSIYVNVYPIESGTNIIISYLVEDESVYKDYFDQLESLTNEELVSHLNFLIIEYTENVFFSPELVEAMTEKEEDSLLRSFASSLDILEKFKLELEQNYFKFNLFHNSI